MIYEFHLKQVSTKTLTLKNTDLEIQKKAENRSTHWYSVLFAN